jgi:primosomal protein N' (replication factor Y)
VAVPLGPRLYHGVVVQMRDALGGNRPLKPVAERLEGARLPERTVEFIQWAARYAVDAPVNRWRSRSAAPRAPKPRPVGWCAPRACKPARPTPARSKVLAAATGPMTPADLTRAAGVSSGVVKALIDEGVLAVELLLPDDRFASPTSRATAPSSMPVRRPRPRL